MVAKIPYHNMAAKKASSTYEQHCDFQLGTQAKLEIATTSLHRRSLATTLAEALSPKYNL